MYAHKYSAFLLQSVSACRYSCDISLPHMTAAIPVVPNPVVQDSTLPAALRSLRHRISGTEQPVTSALDMLQKARQRPNASGNDQQGDESAAGETLNLDARITPNSDGGITVTTSGKTARTDTSPETHQTNKRLAQDEENILLHRHPDDPGSLPALWTGS